MQSHRICVECIVPVATLMSKNAEACDLSTSPESAVPSSHAALVKSSQPQREIHAPVTITKLNTFPAGSRSSWHASICEHIQTNACDCVRRTDLDQEHGSRATQKEMEGQVEDIR